MSKAGFKKSIQAKHAKLMKWARERGIRFLTSKEMERERNNKNTANY